MRTLKEKCAWLNEWNSAIELIEEIKKWIKVYNNEYLHSTLVYLTPKMAEHIWFDNNNLTLSKSA